MGDRIDAFFKKELPSDAFRIKELGNWIFSFSPSNNSLYVSTSEYHAGPLKLTKENLAELIEIIDAEGNRVEEEIVSELEAHLASIIERKGCQSAFGGSKIKLIKPGQ